MEITWKGGGGGVALSFDLVIWRLVWRLRFLLVFVTLTVAEYGLTYLLFQYLVLDFFAEYHGGGHCQEAPSSEPCRQASSDSALYFGITNGIASCSSWFFALALGAYSDTAGRRPCFLVKCWSSLLPDLALAAHLLYGKGLWITLVLRPLVTIFDINGVLLACTNDLVLEPTQRAPAGAVIIGGFVAAACGILPFAVLLPPDLLALGAIFAAVIRIVFLHCLFPETGSIKATHPQLRHALAGPISALTIFSRNSFVSRMVFVLIFGSLSQTGLVTVLMPYMTGYLGITRSDFLPIACVNTPFGVFAYAFILRPFVARVGEVWSLRLCLGITAAFPILLCACDSLHTFMLLCSVTVAPMTLLYPVISGIKSNMVAADEQGIIQGALVAITNVAVGFCDIFFGWLYARATRDGTLNERSSAFPPFMLSGLFGIFAFILAFSLPLKIPEPRKETLIEPMVKSVDLTSESLNHSNAIVGA